MWNLPPFEPMLHVPRPGMFKMVRIGAEFEHYRRLYESLPIYEFNGRWQRSKEFTKAICHEANEMTELEKESAYLGLRYQI
jgi:hypothetical protein